MELDKSFVLVLVIAINVTLVSYSGCLECEPAEKISLTNIEEPVVSPDGIQPLRIAVSAMVSPEETIEYYQEILDYISEKTGRPVELVQRETYKEINELVKSRYLDAAFVCTGAYIEGHKEFNMELLVAPMAYGEPYYYSYIIVSNDSQIDTFDELQGKRFAFTDPLSNTGKLVPTFMLMQMNETPDSFFSSYIYTRSHDKSIKAVSEGIVDGAAVDSLIYDYTCMTSPQKTSQTKIIVKSEPYAIPPVVVHPDTNPELKQELKEILLTMHKDPKGAQTLHNIGIEMFIEINDSAYDSVRQMSEVVRATNEIQE